MLSGEFDLAGCVAASDALTRGCSLSVVNTGAGSSRAVLPTGDILIEPLDKEVDKRSYSMS